MRRSSTVTFPLVSCCGSNRQKFKTLVMMLFFIFQPNARKRNCRPAGGTRQIFQMPTIFPLKGYKIVNFRAILSIFTTWGRCLGRFSSHNARQMLRYLMDRVSEDGSATENISTHHSSRRSRSLAPPDTASIIIYAKY